MQINFYESFVGSKILSLTDSKHCIEMYQGRIKEGIVSKILNSFINIHKSIYL